MKKFLSTWILNAVLAFAAAFGVILQEISIGIASVFGMIMLSLMGAIGGSLLGEAISAFFVNKNSHFMHICLGAAIGLLAALIFGLVV